MTFIKNNDKKSLTMTDFFKWFLFVLLFIYCCDKNVCQAQIADVRNISPSVMLIVDTDGSMELMDNCTCTNAACTACQPSCPNRTNRVNQQNQWNTILQALTGDYSSTFTCNSTTRPNNSPDFGYVYPHYVITTNGTQNTNGSLDSFGTRFRFGLMTSDNTPVFYNSTTTSLIPLRTSFTTVEATNLYSWQGGYSYGPNDSFMVAGNNSVFYLNSGVKNELSTIGRLFSQGAESTDIQTRNLSIQSELRNVRPYGQTSLASMLTDFNYFMNNHADVVNDPYKDCRKKYAVLIVGSEAIRNISSIIDIHGSPYNCENITSGGACPYRLPEETVSSMVSAGTIDGFYVIGVGLNVSSNMSYVNTLNQLASFGGTNQAYFASSITEIRNSLTTILNTSNSGTTARTIPVVYSSNLSTTITSSPSVQSQFNSGYSINPNGGPYSGILERRRTSCVNSLPALQSIDTTDRFHETLNNRVEPRVLYTVLPTVAVNTTKFLLGLEASNSSIPPMGSAINTSPGGGATGTHGNGQQQGQGGSSCTTTPRGGNPNNSTSTTTIPVEEDLTLSLFNIANVSPDHLAISTSMNASLRNQERTRIVNWIHGASNARGTGIGRLGDIYHSSPVIVGRPEFNIPDESYNLYKQRPEVANRPTVLYVASNDGIIHAFATENKTISFTRSNGTSVSRTITAGEELWGFIPPFVLPKLQSATTSHTWTVDGTPYVREVFYRRLAGQDPDASIYHTVMIVPMGKGGGAYVALDITDPFEPKFLWQFADPTMGETLGSPAILQVLVNVRNNHLEERAMVMLSAGYVPPIDPRTCTLYVDGDAWNRPLGCPSQGIGTPPLNGGTQNAVDHHNCWGTDGRQIYFVDPATGDLIQQFGDTVFNAPMTGGIGIYSGMVGTISTRAFMNDADGYMWRFDLSSTNPVNWSAIQFADTFLNIHQQYPSAGQPAYFAPVMTTDSYGNLTIVQGTGNAEYLDSSAPNKVVSYSEIVSFNLATGASTVSNRTNWDVTLNYGEQVTGPIQLVDGIAYFTTFDNGSSSSSTSPSTTNSCSSNAAQARIWGVDYVKSISNNRIDPLSRLFVSSTNSYVANVSYPNEIMFGLTLTQQLSCTATSTTPEDRFDPYLGLNVQSAPISSVTGGAMRIVALSNSNNSYSEFSRTIEDPVSITRILGFAGRAD